MRAPPSVRTRAAAAYDGSARPRWNLRSGSDVLIPERLGEVLLVDALGRPVGHDAVVPRHDDRAHVVELLDPGVDAGQADAPGEVEGRGLGVDEVARRGLRRPGQLDDVRRRGTGADARPAAVVPGEGDLGFHARERGQRVEAAVRRPGRRRLAQHRGDLRPVDRFEVGGGRGVGGPLVDEDQRAGGVLAVDAEDAEGVVRVDPVLDGHRGAGAPFGEQTLEPRPDACRVRSVGGGEREQVGGDA